MKKVLSLLLLVSSVVFAQVPQGISHRGTVYNASGVLVPSHLVKIKASIIESTSTIYSETHTLTTNASGQYSFNIGITTGLPAGETNVVTSGTFAAINWANGINKELKIEIDPTGAGTNYNVSGQNQLMTVPYAFYAQTTQTAQTVANTVKTVNNISELRTIVGNAGDVVFVKGHTSIGDGGGGNFIWRTDASLLSSTLPHSVFSDDNGGIVIQASVGGTPNDSGRWIRQYDGFINVRFFGVGYTGGTPKLEAALKYASDVVHSNNPPTTGTTIFFPYGAWILDKIKLRDGVSIVGDS